MTNELTAIAALLIETAKDITEFNHGIYVDRQTGESKSSRKHSTLDQIDGIMMVWIRAVNKAGHVCNDPDYTITADALHDYWSTVLDW